MTPWECALFVLRHLVDGRLKEDDFSEIHAIENLAGERIECSYLGVGRLDVGGVPIDGDQLQVGVTTTVVSLPRSLAAPETPIASAFPEDSLGPAAAPPADGEPPDVLPFWKRAKLDRRGLTADGVTSARARFACFRRPDGIVALVAHDGRRPWVTAPSEAGLTIDHLRKTLSAARGPTYQRVEGKRPTPGWVVTPLKLDDYLLMLVAWSTEFERFDRPACAQMLVDMWNGCAALALLRDEDWVPELPTVVLSGRPVEEEFEEVFGLFLTLMPARLGVGTVIFEDPEAFEFAPAYMHCPNEILSHVTLAPLVAADQRFEFEGVITAEVAERLSTLRPGADPLEFVASVRGIERWVATEVATLLTQDAGDAHRDLRIERRRRLELGRSGRRPESRIMRFRRWLANQLRRFV
jgi:hypothetical protein